MNTVNPLVYEINTVSWLYELTLKYGHTVTLGNVSSEEWERLRAMGFHYVWLMGVWQRSAAGKALFRMDPEYMVFADTLPGLTDEDLVGSPYSIASYEPDPLVGNWDDIDRVREELNRMGMKLILDFVPNHTAHDHPWVEEHPEYYIQGDKEDYEKDPQQFLLREHEGKQVYLAKGRDPFFPSWQDTLQLNYFNDKTQNAVIREIIRIAEHCDGMRFDMAMLVLYDVFLRTWGWAGTHDCAPRDRCEFWTKVRYAVPDLLMIAEAYWDTEWTLQQTGFDYVYDKRLYDRLIASSPQELYMHLEADVGFQKKLLRFLENHDEQRSMVYFDAHKLTAVAMLFFTIPGMKLVHHGQLEGRRKRLPVQFRRTEQEVHNDEIRGIYERIMKIARQEAFHSDAWMLKEVRTAGDDTNRNFVAYCCGTGRELKLVVVNLGWNRAEGKIVLQGEVDIEKQYVLCDELHEKEYVRDGKEMVETGLHVIIGGYDAHVFNIKEKE